MTIYLNQRSKSRPRVIGEIMYAREEHGDWYNASLRDCTHEGISFLTQYPYLPGTKIVIKSKGRTDTMVQKAQVKWSRGKTGSRQKHGRYSVGAMFE